MPRRGYYGQNASSVGVQFGAPDLSNVMDLASQAGQNAAYADFLEDMFKLREKQAKEAEKQAKAKEAAVKAAASEKASEEDEGSFLSKLADGALNTVDFAIDQISRPMYAVQNTVKYIADQDEDKKSNKDLWTMPLGITGLMGANPINSIDDFEIGDVGGALKAAWKGFSLQEKTTGAQIIKSRADEYEDTAFGPVMKNPWYQGVTGFASDVALDPLTYVGAGLVTKPLKKGVEKAIDEDLVESLVKQDLTRKDLIDPKDLDNYISEGADDLDYLGVKLTAEDYRQLLGQVHQPGQVIPSGLNRRERRAWSRAHEISGRQAIVRKSDQVQQTNQRLERLSALVTNLGKNPAVDSPGVAKLRKMVDETKAAHAKAVDEIGSNAYKSALAKAEASGFDITHLKHERVVSGAKMAALMQAHGLQTWASKSYDKLKSQAVHTESDLKELQRLSDIKAKNLASKEEFLREFDHPGLTDDVVEEAFRVAEDSVRSHNQDLIQKSMAQKNELKSFKPGTQAYENAKKAKEHTDYRLNQARASAFRNVLATRAGLKGAVDTSSIDEQLKSNENLIQSLTKMIDQGETYVGHGANAPGQPSPVGALPEQYLNKTRDELISERKKLVRENEVLFRDAMTTGVSKNIEGPPLPEEWDLAKNLGDLEDLPPEWSKAVRSQLNNKWKDLFEAKKDQWLNVHKGKKRSLKEGASRLEALPEKLQKEFGQATKTERILNSEGKVIVKKGLLSPKITVDGKEILRSKRPKGMSVKEFDEAFKKQHGKSVDNALHDLQKAEGNYVTVAGQKVTKNEFTDWAVQNPEKLAYGFGIRVPFSGAKNGAKMTYEAIKKQSGGMTHQLKDEWETSVTEWVRDTPVEERNRVLQDLFKVKQGREAAKRREQAIDDEYGGIPDEVRTKLNEEAKAEAIASVGKSLKESNYNVDDLTRGEDLVFDVTPEDALKAAKAEARAQYEEAAKAARAAAVTAAGRSRAWTTNNELAALKEQLQNEIKLHEGAYKESVATRKLLQERLREDATLHAIDTGNRGGRTALRLNMLGAKIGPDIPVGAMYKGVEKFSQGPLIGHAWNSFSKAFSPASKLEPEMNLSRLRMQANTPAIIQQHVERLATQFSKFSPAERKSALADVQRGKVTTELGKAIETEFNDMVKYLNGTMQVGEKNITAYDVNSFLPDEFKLIAKGGKGTPNITSGKDIIDNMRNIGKNDPMKALWAMRIATEQVMAREALYDTMRKTFGTTRRLDVRGKPADELGSLTEDLRDKHGWQTVRELGENTFFPADVAEDIRTLNNIMKPGKDHEIMDLVDKALRAWKASVTVYNPGYYSRNAIGEVLMGVFDGLTNPLYYSKARQVQKTMLSDPTKEVLKELEPWKRHETQRQASGRIVAKLPNGEKLTAEDVKVLYHDAGLKSGFISSEYDKAFPVAGTLRSTGPGQLAKKVNDTVRHKGENFEDFFRLSHFIYRLEKSDRGLTIQEAARQAADTVRKYHFDYTDFTPFEKTYMMRLFPFYKWTRKAFPLMASMLFTKPGAVSLYPKAMTGLGYATGAVDPLQDENGLLPNYEGVTPQWMKHMFAYPVGGPDEQGARNYTNVATPAMDVYKMASDPIGTGFGMMNPFVKTLMEQGRGETLDPNFEMDVKTGAERQDQLMRQTPFTSLLDKFMEKGYSDTEETDSPITENGKIDETLFSFLSGLGVYENNKQRQQGEQYRKMLEGK